MLSANVLCLKKKKKKSYFLSNTLQHGANHKTKGSASGAAMLQITEDTPPDMLAGAMDLTIHLPTNRSVKMSVERSTPMMDLLVQITTKYQLQLSGYTLQVLGMAPSKEHSDTVLPYKPNTPIGALDTQHVKVVPKNKSAPVPKNIPPGQQPFESTFRLKVHLPRNQLYVTRVSQSVLLEDILKKVCDEKNLDVLKYEFRHPGNLDETLDPKLTLSDYAITEIHLVHRNTTLSQAFSSGDIMALRKEEERKQMHSKTGGGVFNLIFRRGKSSTGSLSSENRSISPTHSDDSRSVTPPAVPQPKPPQRKRRPAPKPPSEPKKAETGLTICHSRNSSDSSGYHEASILSENCNASLPRRPKSTLIPEEAQSTSSLNHLSARSKSTSNLAVPSRKKKSAPPPPPSAPVLKPETETNLEEPSPVVASQPCTENPGYGQDTVVTNPKPAPRMRTAPSPRPRSLVSVSSEEQNEAPTEAVNKGVIENEEESVEALNVQVKVPDGTEGDKVKTLVESKETVQKSKENKIEEVQEIKEASDRTTNEDVKEIKSEPEEPKVKEEVTRVEPKAKSEDKVSESKEPNEAEIKSESTTTIELQVEQNEKTKENVISVGITTKSSKNVEEELTIEVEVDDGKLEGDETKNVTKTEENASEKLADLQKKNTSDIFKTDAFVTEKTKPPEVVAVHPKLAKTDSKSLFDSYTRKRALKIGKSLASLNGNEEASGELSTPNSVASALNAFDFVDEIEGLDVEMFTGSLSKNSRNKNKILNQLHGMHEFDFKRNPSGGSLRSVSSLPGFVGSNMKKWNNVEELDEISLHSNGGRNGWVIGDTSDTESLASTTQPTPLESLTSIASTSGEQNQKGVEETEFPTPVETKEEKEPELETDWQYQLPSPPKAFRDSSPVTFTEATTADSVVTSPELFEKLKVVKDAQSEKETASDLTSMVSEDEKPILSKLSLENLEKRKSLVYNRELATSLKMSDEERKETFSASLMNFEKTYDEVKKSSPKQATSTLPNFKITTYNPKQKLEIFEDDTVRSNSDRGSKRNSFIEDEPLRRSSVGRSMENISFRKNSLDRSSEDTEYKFYRPAPKMNVFRSESFTRENTWVPSRPVTRSKSQLVINKNETKTQTKAQEENLTKSSSLFDVSGLQSLEVMRVIQNKLNTPNASVEKLDKEEPSYQKQPETKIEVQKEEKPVVRTYRYSPPSINMGTWSERPKIPVNVKEDPDYKYSAKDNTSRLLVNTTNNDLKSYNSIEIINKSSYTNGVSVKVGETNKNVNIKVNGFEPINQNSGNVVIKIGGNNNNNKPVFRKPLGNVNNQRPHSVAFGNDLDTSRVPIVRSVEFKKPYKDYQNNNTSITQIYSNDTVRSTENLSKPQPEPKPVFRVNSFLQNNSAPVVRGFRSTTETNRNSWSQPHSFSTLPAKPAPKNYMLNAPVPFGQSTLRRTESSAESTKKVPPPAPVMPKTFQNPKAEICADPKEQLLQAIRDFGGKKGLRTVKA